MWLNKLFLWTWEVLWVKAAEEDRRRSRKAARTVGQSFEPFRDNCQAGLDSKDHAGPAQPRRTLLQATVRSHFSGSRGHTSFEAVLQLPGRDHEWGLCK